MLWTGAGKNGSIRKIRVIFVATAYYGRNKEMFVYSRKRTVTNIGER